MDFRVNRHSLAVITGCRYAAELVNGTGCGYPHGLCRGYVAGAGAGSQNLTRTPADTRTAERPLISVTDM